MSAVCGKAAISHSDGAGAVRNVPEAAVLRAASQRGSAAQQL